MLAIAAASGSLLEAREREVMAKDPAYEAEGLWETHG